MPAKGQRLEVDTAKLRRAGDDLRAPAERLNKAATDTPNNINALRKDGKPPWGDGEIGEAFSKELHKVNKLIEATYNLGYGLTETADLFRRAADEFVKLEDENSQL